MGGSGTMARWYASTPRLVGSDYIHPLPAGAKIVGELLYDNLRDGYSEYKLRRLKEREEKEQKQEQRQQQHRRAKVQQSASIAVTTGPAEQ